MNKTIPVASVCLTWVAFWSHPAVAGEVHHHEGDIVIGRTGAGQMAFEFDADEAIELPPHQRRVFCEERCGDDGALRAEGTMQAPVRFRLDQGQVEGVVEQAAGSAHVRVQDRQLEQLGAFFEARRQAEEAAHGAERHAENDDERIEPGLEQRRQEQYQERDRRDGERAEPPGRIARRDAVAPARDRGAAR